MDVRPKLLFLMALAVFTAASFSESASATLASELVVSPQIVVPNQRVSITGRGFTSSDVPGGSGPSGSHQISGIGESVITVGGTVLDTPHAFYPIDLDEVGDWTSFISKPDTELTVSGGAIDITTVEDQGFTQTAQVIIRSPSISLDTSSSRINTEVTVSGQGFPASNVLTRANSQVPISYDGFSLAVVSADDTGEFTAVIRVPSATSIPSDNLIEANVLGFSQLAIAVHSVPGPTVTLSPSAGVPGNAVTVSGQGFPPGALVTNIRTNNINVTGSTATFTDEDGGFVAYFSMPVFAPGIQNVFATAEGVTGGSVFTVTQGAPVIEPLPTPPPATTPAQALEALTREEDLLRVWAFDNATKSWEFFDPRPAFVKANTIKTMVPGRIYWFQLVRDQNALLNGKGVSLFEGWNLVPW